VPAASVGIALVAKLKATTAITNVVGQRIYPQLNTQEPEFPEIVYTILGSENTPTVKTGSSSLKRWVVRVDCYAATEIAASALGKLVRDALTPSSGTPWTDSGNGVAGCFHEDSTADYTEDGIRFQGETFGIWHRPT
jgi:hypothetical protein